MALIAYGDSYDTLTFTAKGSRFPTDCYLSDAGLVPEPVTGDTANGAIWLTSAEPGMAVVDYGDGSKVQYQFKQLSNGTYRLVLGSLNITYQKNPSEATFGTLATGGALTSERPYFYSDGEDKERTVTMSFTNSISQIRVYKIYMSEFPILNIPNADTITITTNRMDACTIDEEKIVRSDKLESFSLITFVSSNGYRCPFPTGLLKATQLKTLELQDTCDLSDPDSNGMRGITSLVNLRHLQLTDNNAKSIYLKEYNELPDLNYLDIRTNVDGDIEMEVDEISQNLNYFFFLKKSDGAVLMDSWKEGVSGHKLQNLIGFWSGYGGGDPANLPDYLYELRSMTYMQAHYYYFTTVARADTFVESFYKKVTEWENITMSSTAADGQRNQFYGISMQFYTAYGVYMTSRPSGTLEAPDGFEKGVSNGNPETPMQMVYVLSNNYGQTWVLKPEESSAAALGAAPQKGKLVFTPNGPEYAMGDVITPWETMEVSGRAEAEEECRRRGLPVDNIERYFNDLEHIGEGEL